MSDQPTILILGARGRFGQAAVQAFSRAGWKVVAHIRPGAKPQAMAGVQWLAADPADTSALLAAAPQASVVIHALNPAYTNKAWRSSAMGLLDGSIRVAEALGATLMLPGNVYNFGEAMPALLRVDTPQTATGVKGRVRTAMEQRLRDAAQRGTLRAVVIRAGDFFGSGTGTWLDQAIAKNLHQGRVTWPAGLDTATPWAYLPDLAETFVKVAQQRDRLAAFSQWHFAGHTVTGQQWVDVLSTVAQERGWTSENRPLRVDAMPWRLLRALGLLVPTFASLAEMRYLWRTPHQLDNRELRDLIGEEPRTAFDHAVRQSLHDLGITTDVRVVLA